MYLQRMLDSYAASVTNTDDSELVFRCDNDDLDSVAQLAPHGWNILIGPRREGYKSLPSFYNEMAAVATGDLLICGNDDMLFQTKGWPSLVIAEANKYPNGIFNIGVSTGLNDDKFPFSIVSRQFVQKLGKINDERLLFSDIFLLDVARHFQRAVVLRTVSFFHDWAGHTDDQTRREANQHEFSQVFANAKGDWTPEYRDLHNRVVAEAVAKIDPGLGDSTVDRVLTAFESWVPPATVNGDRWPPRYPIRKWGAGTEDGSIPYDRDETRGLLYNLLALPIIRSQIVIATNKSDLTAIFWGQLFDRVTTFSEPPAGGDFLEAGKYTVACGPVWDTKFVYKTLEKIGQFTAFVLADTIYSALISPYYLLRHAISRPGVIIFSGTRQDSGAGMQRFLSDLRTGYLDGESHDIRDSVSAGGPGFSYEVVR